MNRGKQIALALTVLTITVLFLAEPVSRLVNVRRIEKEFFPELEDTFERTKGSIELLRTGNLRDGVYLNYRDDGALYQSASYLGELSHVTDNGNPLSSLITGEEYRALVDLFEGENLPFNYSSIHIRPNGGCELRLRHGSDYFIRLCLPGEDEVEVQDEERVFEDEIILSTIPMSDGYFYEIGKRIRHDF